MSYYDGSMVRTQVVQLYLSSQNRPSRKEETEQALRAKGRVDLVGELDAMTLILEPAGHWSVVLSRVPRQVVTLDGKTLADALRRVMR